MTSRRVQSVVTPALFALTTFTSSSLLFVIQPMAAKMVLPKLGGSPAVWGACVLFFQTFLLFGYLYAHLTTRRLSVRAQAALQIALLLLALPMLPLAIGSGSPPAQGSPVWWLLRTLTIRLGLPFFLLSATAPLVQRWYATLSSAHAARAYSLYVASNVGSMVALLAYPLWLEPGWGTSALAAHWASIYVVMVALTAASGLVAARAAGPAASASSATQPISRSARARWVGLAFVPSSLMLGVTLHVSTDLAAVPLLWVLPLAAYLLTFILAFSPREWIPARLLMRAMPALIGAALLAIGFQFHSPIGVLLHLAAFFVAALVCHGALARERPAAGELTTFYVCLSLGGVLGGAFNVLLAPQLFTTVFEYPLMLAVVCLLRTGPGYRDGRLEPPGLVVATVVLPMAVSVVAWATGVPPGASLAAVLTTAAILPAVATALMNRTGPFNAVMAVLALALLPAGAVRSQHGDLIFAGRSFFGISRVIEASDHSYRVLQSGSTLHGREKLPSGPTCAPQSYYDPAGPIGQVLRQSGRRIDDAAVVGLGSGALSCYAEPASHWRFYEIDPLVERIARDPRLFTFLATARGRTSIEIGDGRKLLEAAPAGQFDIIILDAFSSDAVPVHLLTREAIALYISRLRPGGVVAIHISNRYLDLEPVLGAIAAAERLPALGRFDGEISPADLDRGRTASHWVVTARSVEDLRGLAGTPGWHPLTSEPGVRPWTDDYSNLFRSIRSGWWSLPHAPRSLP
ncbi:MAG: fused MFS/spermidine synthase [Vicinamibacterales bacterium]